MLPYERLKYNKKHRTDGHQSLVVGKVFSTDVASSSLTVSEREKKRTLIKTQMQKEECRKKCNTRLSIIKIKMKH